MIDPRDGAFDAFLVASVPTAFKPKQRQWLFEHGFSLRTEGGEFDKQAQVEAVETTGICVWNEQIRSGNAKTPLVDDPGLLAVDTVLAGVCMLDHPVFEDVRPRNNQPLKYLCDLYTHSLHQLISRRDGHTIKQEIAEEIYSKGTDGETPHPGRVCTDITTVSTFEHDHLYAEIPLPAASPDHLVRTDGSGWHGEYDHHKGQVDGQLATRVHDNCLYVPAGHLLHKHKMYLRNGGFGALITAAKEMLTPEQHHWITNEASAIAERIDRFSRAGQSDELYVSSDSDRATANLLRNAVSASTDVESGEPLTVSQIQHAVTSFEPDNRWESIQQNRFTGPSSARRILIELAEAGHIRAAPDAGPNSDEPAFVIGSNAETLSVTSIEDLFELPCMANMAERLQTEGPVRKDLFSFARMAMWLPQYRDADIDTIVEDLKDVFKRWPWYDPQETEYQVRYEYHHGEIDGEPPLPRNCSNESLQQYCIGTEECPYHSIYQSVPFPEEMYEHLDSDQDETFGF